MPSLQYRCRPKAKTPANPANQPTFAFEMLLRLIQRAIGASIAPRTASVPAQLMERAEASAGTDPRRAAELRRAALAYLGVVR